MAILSDSKILERISDGDIIIEPFQRKNLGSNSYDVTLGNSLLMYKMDKEFLDTKTPNQFYEVTIPENGYVLKPGILYLGVTNEFTKTKKDVIMFEGKSSLARMGLLVHISSGFGDVGYTGYFTLEFSCIHPIKIYPNMKIGQLYYQTVDGLVINPYDLKKDAKYNNSSSKPIASKMHENFIEEFRDRFRDSGITFNPEKL